MSQEVVIDGTLKPDGTLELDEKPSLSAGHVTVALAKLPSSRRSKKAAALYATGAGGAGSREATAS